MTPRPSSSTAADGVVQGTRLDRCGLHGRHQRAPTAGFDISTRPRPNFGHRGRTVHLSAFLAFRRFHAAITSVSSFEISCCLMPWTTTRCIEQNQSRGPRPWRMNAPSRDREGLGSGLGTFEQQSCLVLHRTRLHPPADRGDQCDPHLAEFGIAKAVDHRARAGARPEARSAREASVGVRCATRSGPDRRQTGLWESERRSS